MALLKHLLHKINENTRKNTHFRDAAEPSRLFQKLQVEGTLELEEVNFDGYRIPGGQFLPGSSKVNRKLVDEKASNVRDRVQLDIILKKFKRGHICFIGHPGMGKSTLIKMIARRVLSRESEGLEEIEVIHFVQCSHYKPGDHLTIGAFLFGSVLDEEEIKVMIKFTILYPNKILFILDSLHTLRFSADGVYKNITADEEAGPGAILWNFLSGKVLPNCRIITSSREYSIRNYMGEVRPQMVISLLGFMEETIKQVITGYVGEEKAKQTFALLKEKFTVMLALCNIPVILVYTLIALHAKSDLDATTMTRIMVIIFQIFIRSPHMLHKDPLDTMYKLEELSHLGNMEGKVQFFLSDFDKVGLEPEKATDLTAVAPQQLMQGESVMSFAHDTIQKVLGALWIAGGDVDVLKEFVKACMDSDHCILVRRFLCGILLDQEVYEAVSDGLLAAVADIDDKKSILLEHLRSELEPSPPRTIDATRRENLLNLFLDLNEGKDGTCQLVQSSVKEIVLGGIKLKLGDVEAVASVMKQCKCLLMVDLNNCNLTERKMDLLCRILLPSNLKIRHFNVIGNVQLGSRGMQILGKMVRSHAIVELEASSCDSSSDHIQSLAKGLDDAKLEILWLVDDQAEFVEMDYTAWIDLLSCIKNELHLREWKIKKRDQSRLNFIIREKPVLIYLNGVLMDPSKELIHERSRKVSTTSDSSEYWSAEEGESDPETDPQSTQEQLKEIRAREVSTILHIGVLNLTVNGNMDLKGDQVAIANFTQGGSISTTGQNTTQVFNKKSD